MDGSLERVLKAFSISLHAC